MPGILGFDFHLGPKVEAPEHVDFTLSRVEVARRRLKWAAEIQEAVRYEGAWAVLTTKPNGDVLLFDVSWSRLVEATSWGGTVHLLLAREAKPSTSAAAVHPSANGGNIQPMPSPYGGGA